MTVVFLALGGCEVPAGEAPISGFKPIYPPQRLSISMPVTGPGSENFSLVFWQEVDSLQPTLQWQPFPGIEHKLHSFNKETASYESAPFIEVDERHVSDVRYDLKIWKASNRTRGNLVYERTGIEGTSHRIDEPLEPDTRYLWTIRARFRLDGKPRLTEWSMINFHSYAIQTVEGCFNKWTGAQCTPREVVRKTGRIPTQNYYHFMTQ
jgi:hypothetical protein